jgi:SAM-dependent methyltransferase
MTTFKRDDGTEISIVPGFRDRVLSYRPRMSPRTGWSDDDYALAVEKRLQRGKRYLDKLSRLYGSFEGAETLEVGCGDGINSILLSLRGVKQAVGIDLELRLNQPYEWSESVRQLAERVVNAAGTDMSLDQCLDNYPVELRTMDATRMEFPDESFDLVFSRGVLEHIYPIEKLSGEISRILRPRGIVYHEIDPFYWLRGCHKRGLVDIPWAHARLTLPEYNRFVTETEGEAVGDKRLKRLRTLNRLSLREWRALLETDPFEIILWEETPSSFAEEVLREYPDAVSTALPGLQPNDLVVRRIRVCLQKKAD